MVFPVGMYGFESWTIKKAEHRRIDAFELWCWRRRLRIPWTARRSNQSILKEINPGCSLEGLMWKLKLWPPDAKSWLIGKDPDVGEGWGQEAKGTIEDEMVRWHHWLDGHEFGWTPGVGNGQRGLACCDSWGCKELDMIEWLNWTELNVWLKWWYKHDNKWELAPLLWGQEKLALSTAEWRMCSLPSWALHSVQQMVVIWEVKPSGFRFVFFPRNSQIQILNEKSPGLKALAQFFVFVSDWYMQAKQNSSVSLTWPIGCQLMTPQL